MPTEKELMIAGELYDPNDPELAAHLKACRELLHQLNHSQESEKELRREVLKKLLGRGGDSVQIQPPFFCDYGFNIHLGQRVFFNFNCVVLDVCPVEIGDFTLFAPNVQIYAATHPLDVPTRRVREFGKPIKIGSDVWVGGGSIILPGVTIGDGSIIGAGSVVTKDIPAGVIAVGNPCRVLRKAEAKDRE